MQLQIVSWDGWNAINDSMLFEAWFPEGSVLLQADGRPATVERTGRSPVYTYKGRSARTLPIHIKMLGDIPEQIDLLKAKLNTFDDSGLKKLLVRDLNNWTREWYVMATAISMPRVNGQEVIFNLLVPDSVWYAQNETSVTWAITASGQTKIVVNGGNFDAQPVYTLTPTANKSSGAGYRDFVAVSNQSDVTLINYPVCLHSAWNTAALIAAGKMQTDGSDIDVLVDGEQVNWWVADINSADTELWINLDLAPQQALTLGLGIASSGGITELIFESTTANATALEALPTRGWVRIGSEEFYYSGKNVVGYRLYGVTRAVHGTSMAAHSIGDPVQWLEHEIAVLYGNNGLPAFTIDDHYKPMFNLSTSTNTSWDYDDYVQTDAAASPILTRPGSWSWLSTVYPDSINVSTPPDTTQAGRTSKVFSVAGGSSPSISFNPKWRLFHPLGITHVALDGYGYRNSQPTWVVVFSKSLTGIGTYTQVFSIAQPGALSTVTPWSQVNTSLNGTYPYVEFDVQNANPTGSGTLWCEMNNTTVTLDSSLTPTVSFGSEQTVYGLSARITNQGTGDYITIAMLLPLGGSLEINTEDKTVTYLGEGSTQRQALGLSSIRFDWLKLQPGANDLQYDETDAAGVTLGLAFRERQA